MRADARARRSPNRSGSGRRAAAGRNDLTNPCKRNLHDAGFAFQIAMPRGQRGPAIGDLMNLFDFPMTRSTTATMTATRISLLPFLPRPVAR
jgi:hypothetical protein